MKLKTPYGSIEIDDLDDFDLSGSTKDFIKGQIEASEVFFSDEVDLEDIKGFDDEIKEIAEIIIVEEKFSEPEKAFALSELHSIDLADIEEESYGVGNFTTSSDGEYMVLTDDEADELALEYNENLLDDIGLDVMSEYAKEHIYSNFVDTDWFDEAMKEYNYSYAEDIKTETSSDDDLYVSRLHEEMVERGVMDEPEWPEEDDYSDGEPEEDDFEDSSEFDDAWETWEDERQEKLGAAIDDFRTDLENEVDSNVDEFAEKMNDDYENGLDYWEQHFGADDISRVAKEQGLVDMEEVAKWLLEEDGRGNALASYDGEENDASVKYKGKDYDFYVYRTG